MTSIANWHDDTGAHAFLYPAPWVEQPTSSQSHVTWAVYLPLTQSDNTMQTNNIYTDWQLQGTTRCKQESFFNIYV